MTIDDDDVIPTHGEEGISTEDYEIGEVGTTHTSKKRKKSFVKDGQASKTSTDTALEPTFSFDISGGGIAGPVHAWDFTSARKALKEQKVGNTLTTELTADL